MANRNYDALVYNAYTPLIWMIFWIQYSMSEKRDGSRETEFSISAILRHGDFNVLWKNRKVTSIFALIAANIFNNIVVFLINIIVAKKFGPDNFGIFSLATSYMIAVNLIVDLGINLTIVRFYNLYDNNTTQQDTLLLSLLTWKVAVVILVVMLSFPLGLLAVKVFSLPHSYTMLFTVSTASAGIFGLWLYFHSYLQAHKRFKKLAVFIALGAVFRIACFTLIYGLMTSGINLTATFNSIYTIPLVIASVIGLGPVITRLIVKRGFPNMATIKSNLVDILKYGKWVALSGLCHSFIYRGVQFILATRTTKFELGIFSAGFVFTLAFTPFNTAVRTVFFPHVTAYKGKDDMNLHLRRIKRIFPLYVIGVIIGICCLALIQVFFLGDEYTTALPVFLITAFALTMTIYFGLASMLVHTLMRPEIDAYTNIGRLLISAVVTFFLAPSLGAIGGALSYAIPLILGEILMVLYVRKLLNA